jgi:hypothetical protein
MYPKRGEPRQDPSKRHGWGGYPVVLDKEGCFRVEDVAAGTYEMRFRVYDPSRKSGENERALGTARREVIVPQMPGGRSDEPFDLGTIPLVPVR